MADQPVTLKNLAYNILNIMRGGRSTNNEYISVEQLKFNIKYYRSLFIRRDLEREQNFRKFEHDLGFINMELHEEAEGLGSDLSTTWLRSTKKLPQFVRLQKGPAVTFVGPPDKRTRFPIVEIAHAPYIQYSKYTPKDPRAYLLNGYIYLSFDPGAENTNKVIDGEVVTELWQDSLESINVRGIFEDPEEVATFLDLDPDTMNMQIPMDMAQRITQSIIGGEMRVLTGSRNDDELDALPDNV